MQIVNSFLQNPIRMSVDILIVAYVIYLSIEFFKKTNAFFVVRGILVVVVMKFVSDFFHLYALSWLIGQIITWGVIALFVIFQPEIRRSLEQLGQNKLFHSTRTTLHQTDQTEYIMEAVKYLSKRKIGSLMCFESNVSLMEFAQTGVPLNAQLSTQLLINLFIPNTPLHDGAVIIKEDTVISASCVLPLSDNINIPQELGTRHRAAVGLSEQSDAVIVVISVETGDSSIAYRNMLYRDLDEDKLAMWLNTHVYRGEKNENDLTIIEKWKHKLFK